MKTKLHRAFGPNLKNLYNPVAGTLNHKSLKENIKLTQTTTYPFGFDEYPNIMLDPAQTSSFVLGWIVGVQYQDSTPSNCFYSFIDTLTILDSFGRDWENLLKYY
jgi:hypothetical protein